MWIWGITGSQVLHKRLLTIDIDARIYIKDFIIVYYIKRYTDSECRDGKLYVSENLSYPYLRGVGLYTSHTGGTYYEMSTRISFFGIREEMRRSIFGPARANYGGNVLHISGRRPARFTKLLLICVLFLNKYLLTINL